MVGNGRTSLADFRGWQLCPWEPEPLYLPLSDDFHGWPNRGDQGHPDANPFGPGYPATYPPRICPVDGDNEGDSGLPGSRVIIIDLTTAHNDRMLLGGGRDLAPERPRH